jgi:hypothetical protein
MKTFETIGNVGLSFGNTIISVESNLFHTFNYTDPVYNLIKRIEQYIPNFDGSRPPSFNYHVSNIRSRKTSSGCHLASYFSCKRHRTIRQVITPQVQYYNHPYNNKHKSTDKNPKNIPTSDWMFQPLNNLSCHDDTIPRAEN